MTEPVKEQEIPLPRFPRQEGLRGRDGGPYLDEIEALREEEARAHREGRPINPNNIYDRHDVVTADALVDNTYSNPGSRDRHPYSRINLIPSANVEYTPEDQPELRGNLEQLTGNVVTEVDSTLKKTETDKDKEIAEKKAEKETAKKVAAEAKKDK